MRHACLLILLAAAGCVDLKTAYPDRKIYALEAARTGEPRGGGKDVLRVRRFLGSKLCDGSELVTRTGDSTWESDYYNVFFVPPVGQVMELTQRWLGVSGLFANVVPTGATLPETHVLEGNLVALHGDLRPGKAPTAVIELQFLLTGVTADPAVALLQKSYRQDIGIEKGDAEAMLAGWNAGLAKIISALEADLAKALRR